MANFEDKGFNGNMDNVPTIDILIVTALPEEMAALDDLFDFDAHPLFINKAISCYINPDVE